MDKSKERSKLSEKAEANRKFLISSWSSCFPKRPPSNKQELYANAKEYYAKLNNGGIFTCSGGDLSACIHELKSIYKSSNPQTLLSCSRYDPNAASNTDISVALDELGNELARVATDYQNYLIKSVSLLIGNQINNKLGSFKEAKAKLDKALNLLRANNIDFDPNEFALVDSSANVIDFHLNSAQYDDAIDCHHMADKSKQALNAVLKNIVPGLDQSIDNLLKDFSSLSLESVDNADKLPSEQVNHEAPKADHEATLESLDDAATKQATIKKPSKRTAKAKKQAPSKEATKATDNAGNEPLNDADKGILQPQSMEGAGDAMEAIKQDESYQALSSDKPSTPVAKSSKTAKTTKSNSRAKKSTKQEPVKGDTKPSNTADTSAKKPRSKSKAPARKAVEDSSISSFKVEDVTEEEQAKIAKLVRP